MDWLNYHHLRYFWVVAAEGSITAACERLHVAQPTISAQLKTLEDQIGAKLFVRSGRALVLTEAGQIAYKYAEKIFGLGSELLDSIQGDSARRETINIGVVDVVPKLIAFRLLEPALSPPLEVRLVCHEASEEVLLVRLARHDLHMVISDSPASPGVRVRAFNHLLSESGVSIYGAKNLVASYRRGFPRSLNGAPFLLPLAPTTLRRSLDGWFESERIRPLIIGEFEDSALLKAFAQAGKGLFVAPDANEKEIKRQYGVRVVGRIPSIRERYYLISLERHVRHPAAVAIAGSALDTTSSTPP